MGPTTGVWSHVPPSAHFMAAPLVTGHTRSDFNL